jgi:cysteine desulfurase
MLPFYSDDYGNAASKSHVFGWRAEEAVEVSRETLASSIGAGSPREIVFTSGATESNNLALKGVAEMQGNREGHLVTVATEHRSVLDPCGHLETRGFRTTVLPVDRDGLVEPEAVGRAITDATVLVSVMAANNEIGVLQPLEEIGSICRERGVLFHTDAVQALGKVPVDVDRWQVDLLSISAHKLYGPKGVGALYVRRRRPRLRLVPLLHGGGHERGLRSGTLPVPLIAGFGRAVSLCDAERSAESQRISALRERLRERLLGELEGVQLLGHPTRRLPGNLNLGFEGVDADSLLVSLHDVALSSGSACTSATPEPSHVIAALGLDRSLERGSVRFGIGRFNTREEIDYAASRVIEEVRKLRGAAPS